jgi:CRP-like cAMP-binding protein
MIGLPNMICGGEQTANVSAATNVRVFSIPAKFLAERMKVSDELSRNIMLALCLENSGLSLEVERMKCQTALQRLAEFLFQICPIDKGAAEFSLPYSKSLIASRLGVRPESFSRLLARLKKYGVKVTGDNIQVGEVKMLLALMSEDTSSQNHAQWA